MLVRLHTEQHVVEQPHGLDDVWSLVQHDALSVIGQCHVAHFRTRGYPLFRQPLQHLVAQMTGTGGLAEPENLFRISVRRS